ncbi:MAG: hypothetical protein JXA82_01925 [Sedimentisphaerales bacterium]|nr:hypothetical protein [Sedimentisphaerales bacterium]
MWPFKQKTKPARVSLPVTLHAKYDVAQTIPFMKVFADHMACWNLAG